MILKPFDKNRHYPKLAAVWKHHDCLPCPLSFLPKTGYVMERPDGTFIAALFIYIDPGSVAFVTWAVGAIDALPDEKTEAFASLFRALKERAIACKCTFIYSVTPTPAYMKRLESWGMFPVETNMSSYVMPLHDETVDFLKD